jgi:glycosyltransferase involved in cell wall biosynthesis
MIKNILYIVDTGMIKGGGEISLLTLLENLDRKSFRPLVCLPEQGDLGERIKALGIQVHIFSYRRLINPFNTGNTLRTIRGFADIIRIEGICLVHTNCSGGLIFMAGKACSRAGIPLISHARTVEAGKVSDFFQSRLSTRIIATSTAVAKQFSFFKAPDNVRIVPNAVDAAKFQPNVQARQAIRRQLGCAEEEFLVGNVSSYQPGKGLEYFIKAASDVSRNMPNVRFLIAGFEIAGSKAYRESLERLCARAGLKDKVLFLINRNDIPDILSALDVFAFSTLKEGFGRVVIEAMANAKPVAAFASGGVADIIQQGITGFLVKPVDHKGLAARIMEILKDKELAGRLGQKARIEAQERFSIQAHVARIQNIYSEVLA